MNPYAIGALAWLATSVIAAFTIGRWMRGHQTPSPGVTLPPGDGPPPGAGDAVPAVPQAAETPSRQSPAPATDCGPVHAGIGFNRAGCMFTWDPRDGWQHKQHRLPFNVAEWEAKLP